ncbi:MAG: flavin reductase family protein [Candidatus Bathyarchaeota archaeon]|nr:flavin reductase family protein [Candidatus Bathyarchaeota archaeon]
MSAVNDLVRYMPITYLTMTDIGLLLGSVGYDGKPNLMTIGWGLVGVIWYKPIFMVAVRISRYTYKLMEESGEFTVNVPSKEMSEACRICGTISGRDADKFEKTGLKWRRGDFVKAPVVEGCPIVYECKVLYKDVVNLQMLPGNMVETIYPKRDAHILYYGEILKIHGEPKSPP